MTTPPPPPPPPMPPTLPMRPGGRPPRRPVEGKRIWLGVGIALIGHVVTLLIPLGVSMLISGEAAANFIVLALIAQAILAVAILVIGIVLAVKQDGGVGVGLLIGWAIGLLITPVVGFGVCVALLNQDGFL